MIKAQKETQKKHSHRHLTPLEIITIAEAIQRGEKVATLSKQFGVSRQTIYNAVQTVKEKRIQSSNKDSGQSIPSKRKRITRIAPELCQQLIELKR